MLRHLLSAIVLVAGLSACTPAEETSTSTTEQAAADSSASGLTPSAEGAMAYIISPEDGATVSSPVTVRFGLKGMGVAPAGVQVPNTGHHHLMIDVTDMPALTAPLPADSTHIHFGGGQTETVLDLPPGEHTLQLVLGDFAHRPHNPPLVSGRVTITVQ
jgi:hypothetical protein